jgi:hypothetical protein
MCMSNTSAMHAIDVITRYVDWIFSIQYLEASTSSNTCTMIRQ